MIERIDIPLKAGTVDTPLCAPVSLELILFMVSPDRDYTF